MGEVRSLACSHQALIGAGATANDRDAHSYTPMHAAASYAHLELLAYLVSVGGDVNLPDDDGDTPLFTCESVDAARWLVEHGADAGHRNGEGMSVSRWAGEGSQGGGGEIREMRGRTNASPPRRSRTTTPPLRRTCAR